MKRITSLEHYGIEWKAAQYGGFNKSTGPDTEGPIATGGKLGCFRPPEPNGEAVPAFFGISPQHELINLACINLLQLFEHKSS